MGATMALNRDRALDEMKAAIGPEFPFVTAAGFRVFRGGIVAVCQDGTILPAGSANPPSPIVAIAGVCRDFRDNTGSAIVSDMVGDEPVQVMRRTFALPFDVMPTWANVNAPVYAVDDETVTLTENAVTESAHVNRLQVGTLVGFDLSGTPYVKIG